MVLLAGVIAETMTDKGDFDQRRAFSLWKYGGGRDDHSKFSSLIQVLRNIQFPSTTKVSEVQDQLTRLDRELTQRTGELVQRNIRPIGAVAEALSGKVSQFDRWYELSVD